MENPWILPHNVGTMPARKTAILPALMLITMGREESLDPPRA